MIFEAFNIEIFMIHVSQPYPDLLIQKLRSHHPIGAIIYVKLMVNFNYFISAICVT